MSAQQEFFDKYAPIAINSVAGTGLLPSVVLAQAALESGYGASRLSAGYNNFFGIKATKGRPSVIMTTEEYDANHNLVTVKAAFRSYSSPSESFASHANLLQTPHYAAVAQKDTAQGQALALQNEGYGGPFNKTYANRLMSIINQFGLTRFDSEAKKKELAT
jgi:mannosyl-glycoprotein endo-beta-N-acetylglucosaminidase